MENNEILESVNKSHPKMMAKTAHMVALLEKIDSSFVPDVLSDFNAIFSMVNEKTADAKAYGLTPFLWGVGGTAAGGLLGAISTDLYDAAKRGLTKGHNFTRIMEANPHLKREVDKGQLRMAYDALHRFAPDFTADPMLGGALLKQISELPQMSHKTIVELIGARKEIQDAKGRHFADMARQGVHLVPNAPREGAGAAGKERPGE